MFSFHKSCYQVHFKVCNPIPLIQDVSLIIFYVPTQWAMICLNAVHSDVTMMLVLFNILQLAYIWEFITI